MSSRRSRKSRVTLKCSGYNVTSHWLGRGSTIFDHKEPDARLPIRIFNELKIPRETVFTQWGLRPQTFIVNTGGGI